MGSTNAVNAREFWEQLEVKTRFNDWIRRRIEDSMFVEGQDYLVVTQTRVTEGTEYIVSLKMAKHIAMMERTGKGYEVRQYINHTHK
ncbi:antA/AntB antirepressor family protein [Sulfurimonas diazotrophicus]|uniref:AntA/AntB antirepressor family protein n=1 Tax=Sulfurimonas diazotrophicus TaxID=3131939 RepID=A0ABZ3HAA3_9BACT